MITQSCMNYARLSNLVFSICKDQINQGLWVFRNSCLFIYKLFHVICDGKRLQQSACGTSSQSINSFASETNLILEWLVDTNIVTLAKFGEIYAITCRETYFWNNFLEEKHPSYRLDTSWTQAHVIYCVKILTCFCGCFFQRYVAQYNLWLTLKYPRVTVQQSNCHTEQGVATTAAEAMNDQEVKQSHVSWTKRGHLLLPSATVSIWC